MGSLADNLILGSLPTEAAQFVRARCRRVSLPQGTRLLSTGERTPSVHFITSGLASIVICGEEGSTSEVNLVGNEGAPGLLQLLGPAASPVECTMQIAGSAERIARDDLQEIFNSSEQIRATVLRRVQVDYMITAQISSCNRLHTAEERLARWLLTASDRLQSQSLELTQHFLADMLGARRATVTLVAGVFQRSGLIEYRRGRIRILHRQMLEDAACECYRIVRNLNTSFAAPKAAQAHP